MTRRALAAGAALARLLLLAALIGALAVPLAPVAQARPADNFPAYLPLIARQRPGLSGQVTLNGAPIGGVPLNLLFYSGSVRSTLATTSTAADGSYAFSGAPSLGPGQDYQVQFDNQSQPPVAGRMAVWYTHSLASYAAGTGAAMGDFDVAAVTQLTPTAGATVPLPATFTWTPRAAAPSDGYQILLFKSDGSANYLSARLGYANHYALNSLPAGFSLGTLYHWVVVVNSPDDGIGSSSPAFGITFSH